jgi:hypothetical protein
MAMERLPMRKIREILRLRWQQGRSVRETARSVGASVGAVCEATTRAKAAGLDWEAAEKLGDSELERLLYQSAAVAVVERPKPDPVYIHTELIRTPASKTSSRALLAGLTSPCCARSPVAAGSANT